MTQSYNISQATKPGLAEYIQERYGWSDNVMGNVKWTAHGSSLRRKLQRKTHYTKLVHGILPTGKQVHRRDPTRNKCPLCHTTKEDWSHIIKCLYESRRAWRAQVIPTLEAKCESLHRLNIGSTLFINGTPVTGNYDACIRFHVNGYHQHSVIQKTERWNNSTWDKVDCNTFGKHFRRLRPSRRSIQHFKFVHEVLPLGIQRSREAAIPDSSLKCCPCCKRADETHHHFLQCTANPVFASSLLSLQSEMLTRDIHPIRYLLSAGVHHTVTSDTPFVPAIDQYPPHFHSIITSALSSQQEISWNSAIKGYFTQDWADMAQLDMSTNIRDARKGKQRMKQLVISALASATMFADYGQRATAVTTTPPTLKLLSLRLRRRSKSNTTTRDHIYFVRAISITRYYLVLQPLARRNWLRKVKQSSH